MRRIIFVLSFAFVFISCKKSPSNEVDYATDKVVAEEEAMYSNDALQAPQAAPEAAPTESSNASTAIPIDQKIIKNGNLRFETADMNKTAAKIYAALKTVNGYVQLDSETKGYNEITRNIVIRVPNQNFEKLVNNVTQGISYFDEKQITSEDVTEQYIDLEARLKSKKELEARYIDLLRKANKVSDIIEVEQQINVIREEIESKQGQLNYMKSRVSMSTLNITFYKPTAESGITVSYGDKIVNALKGSVSWIPGFFIGLIYIWPLFLIVGLAWYFIRKKLNKSKK